MRPRKVCRRGRLMMLTSQKGPAARDPFSLFLQKPRETSLKIGREARNDAATSPGLPTRGNARGIQRDARRGGGLTLYFLLYLASLSRALLYSQFRLIAVNLVAAIRIRVAAASAACERDATFGEYRHNLGPAAAIYRAHRLCIAGNPVAGDARA